MSSGDDTFSRAPHANARLANADWCTTPSQTYAPIALEPGEFTGALPPQDRRPVLPEPPPVSLELVADAHLPAINGLEHALDDFYVGILQFERDAKSSQLAYKAENFRLVFDLTEVPEPRDDFRMIGIVVKSLPVLAEKLHEAQIEFADQRGLSPGERNFVLQDPAGNWLRISCHQPF